MSIRIIQGDVREELPKLPADYFDCIVTSPPYYGLRDYGTATWEGGDPACDHRQLGHAPGKETPGGRGGSMPMQEIVFKETCGKCGAIRIDAQIGLEPTIDEYLETMVAVCRELRRVLKPSGVFFLNIGDSYNGGGIGGGGGGNLTKPNANRRSQGMGRAQLKVSYLKPKDLMLVPERLGIALQADGWWVRSHIIWAKPNPMPESVTDRPTSAHETIWMLTKSARYFWDGEAVRELPTGRTDTMRFQKSGADRNDGNMDGWSADGLLGANLRNVWTIPSHPFPGAHFATFPPSLVERCIKAGSSERGCCPACGAPWVRVVEYGKPNLDTPQRGSQPYSMAIGGTHRDGKRIGDYAGMPIRTSNTIGWQPSCECASANTVPSRILDPFAGSGTTGLVADRLGRDCTLIDLNTSYIDMAVNRIRDDAPLFAEVAAE